ncbi:hypothetical protein P3X46_011040 [Hevea brasiliensis]|uniref:Protein kinase domain-containing protein n=1 Tax=Hevea brasiliensis TaxID=3981 RepID=A0ABQ9MJS6_HEVBR|nr:non-functional pseudokinase ZED1 [Hevea brasiliensis]KAJ9179230.1 hypothetical protein P3X46_011040 [Hevea brasiliensis]
MIACFRPKKDRKTVEETSLMINGRMLLESSVAFNNGRGNPIRSFSFQELNSATNNFDPSRIFWDDYGLYKLYNGFLHDRPIILKKLEGNRKSVKYSIKDIVFASQFSSHKNVLKLLGCCLETEIPLLVFESAKNGTLHDHIYNPHAPNFRPLSWKSRLKIALGVANAIAYLHAAFPKPIIHRDIKPSNILLDEDYVPKLVDFTLSESIPEGHFHVQHGLCIENVPTHILGFLAPEHFLKSFINEKVDIYSFGVVLLSLLTGKRVQNPFPSAPPGNYSLVQGVKKYMETQKFNEIVVDPAVLEEGPWPGKEQQLQNFAMLALQCTCDLEDNRPEIIDVAKQLRQMYKSAISNC